MKFLVLEEVDSTNSYVSVHSAELDDMTMVIADRQTAGRGQRGNSWESEAGRNLTFTLLWRPESFAPRDQFAISEAVALAMIDFLGDLGIDARIKWPNDIYVGDRKIAGILIEHSITPTSIEHTRIGVGLNVNQTEFVSDAPNPVSIKMIDGREREISRVAAAVGAALQHRLAQCCDSQGRDRLHQEFQECLWRADGGFYPFRHRDSGRCFNASIVRVEPSGPILLRDAETGEQSSYFFKEIEFIL